MVIAKTTLLLLVEFPIMHGCSLTTHGQFQAFDDRASDRKRLTYGHVLKLHRLPLAAG